MDLSKLNVLDLSTVLAGPSVATFFGELNANVTKVEHPLNKDVTRSWKSKNEKKESKTSAYFSSVNYKKKYLTLDLTKDNSRKKLDQLLINTDILITNFKRSSEKKLNLIPEELQKKFPGLIHGRISGFGDDSDRIAYDLIIQAESGLMSINGNQTDPPTKLPIAFVDILAAHQLKEGILLSLLEKQKTGTGNIVSVSLYDSAICSLANQASNFLMLNENPKRMGSLHPNIAPYGEIFTTKDEKMITFAIGTNKHFGSLCNFLMLEYLQTDNQFSSNQQRVVNRKILAKILQDKISTVSSNAILKELKSLHVPVAEIKSFDEVFKQKEALNHVRKEIIDNEETYRVSSIAFKHKKK